MTLRAGLAKLVGAALAGSLLFVVAPATAKPCNPHGRGNSEISQYLENVPGPCGDQNVPGGGNGGDGSGSGAGSGDGGGGGGSGSFLPASSAQQLSQLGAAGKATADFAEATAPPGAGNAKAGNGSGQSGGTGTGSGTEPGAFAPTAGGADDGSAMDALGSLVSGGSSEGIGTLLPLLLGAIFLGGMGFVALRRGYTR
jgi:hypothetical protein